MHSVGGEWSDGMAIYDAISMSRSYITIIAYGQAESMSSIIFQAADRRLITPNTYFMSHYGSYCCWWRISKRTELGKIRKTHLRCYA